MADASLLVDYQLRPSKSLSVKGRLPWCTRWCSRLGGIHSRLIPGLFWRAGYPCFLRISMDFGLRWVRLSLASEHVAWTRSLLIMPGACGSIVGSRNLPVEWAVEEFGHRERTVQLLNHSKTRMKNESPRKEPERADGTENSTKSPGRCRKPRSASASKRSHSAELHLPGYDTGYAIQEVPQVDASLMITVWVRRGNFGPGVSVASIVHLAGAAVHVGSRIPNTVVNG